MATKFLRKIILEELQKVLKEDNMSSSDDFFKKNIADDGDSYTSGPSGKTSSLNPISLNPGQAELGRSYKTKSYGSPEIGKKSPKPGDLDFMGPEQPTPIPGSGSEIKSSPRRIATLKLQKKLAELGFLDKKDVIGIFGPKTTSAINGALEASGIDALNAKDIQKIPTEDIKTMVAALSIGNKDALQKIAVKYRVEQATAGVDAALKRDQTSPSATPAGDSVHPIETPGEATKKREAEKEKELQQFRQNLGTPPEGIEESIAREIRKLLRSI